MTSRPCRSRNQSDSIWLAALPAAALHASAAVALVCALPAAAAAQGTDLRGSADGSPSLEARAGALLSGEGLSWVTQPGFSVGLGASVPVTQGLFVRVDGDLGLPGRDVPAGPLIDIYSGIASLEYVARQQDPDRLPLRTALSLGAGVSVLDAAEMPVGASPGSTFREPYLTVSAGARLGYPVTSRLVVYAAPGVRWFDVPAEDWNRLTEGLGVDTPEHGWMVPLTGGIRISF